MFLPRCRGSFGGNLEYPCDWVSAQGRFLSTQDTLFVCLLLGPNLGLGLAFAVLGPGSQAGPGSVCAVGSLTN